MFPFGFYHGKKIINEVKKTTTKTFTIFHSTIKQPEF